MIVKRFFYQKNTLEVAQKLLGCFLIRKIGQKNIKALITETEAYRGINDLASHASRGRTPRTELMFGEAGHAYIYLIYGMYYCLNVVTEKKDYPAAVLIRAVKIDGIDYKKTNGPGKVCRELKIDRVLNNWDITQGKKLWIEQGVKISPKDIKKAKRIGVEYADHCKNYLWRFFLKNSKIFLKKGRTENIKSFPGVHLYD